MTLSFLSIFIGMDDMTCEALGFDNTWCGVVVFCVGSHCEIAIAADSDVVAHLITSDTMLFCQRNVAVVVTLILITSVYLAIKLADAGPRHRLDHGLGGHRWRQRGWWNLY